MSELIEYVAPEEINGLTGIHFEGELLVPLIQRERDLVLGGDAFGECGIAIGELLRKVGEVPLCVREECI